MTLSDKEIALELTKITVEHFNIRVAQSIRQSGLTDEIIEQFYKRFYKTVTNLKDNHPES
ncbi:hypothetical protein [Streptococcus oralis]|uniref:hypothetical protein n=1 Tax=Streptococcus oralis TaxID=1303 RepID=UPI00066C7D6B|nr:hypothetical protein [Streptococcus oralis]DAS45956.1 MAG TPA: hypothetical protein [Caudoviricetes sp.]